MKHTAVVLFYKYFPSHQVPAILREYPSYYEEKLRRHQHDLCTRLHLRGRVLLSIEGINGTLSAKDSGTLERYIASMEAFDLIGGCGVPDTSSDGNAEHSSDYRVASKIYSEIDWKMSQVDDDTQEPFPDLKVCVVDEIVSTGGTVHVDEIIQEGGQHLSPLEFHEAIRQNQNIVLIDVRNTFEWDVGHFVNPSTQEDAISPEMVTFSSFDSTFCAKHSERLRDKKVLMYCTGGIRCEKASVMLKKRGVRDVSQLKGGIHRYLEEYGDQGFFKGRNFVFDQRVAICSSLQKNASEIVGKCLNCSQPFDEISGSRVCTVCRDLVLVCPSCQLKLREYHCRRHFHLKDCYFTFLDVFDIDELQVQRRKILRIRDNEMNPASEFRNMRRTLNRQLGKIDRQILMLLSGAAKCNPCVPSRCRTCMETSDVCDGLCWGFWKHSQIDGEEVAEIEPVLPIHIGNRVEPGPNWNTLRLGERMDSNGKLRKGTVTEIKSWATGGDTNDSIAVVWDEYVLQRKEPQIYRWGFIARNRRRMYDVQIIVSSEDL